PVRQATDDSALVVAGLTTLLDVGASREQQLEQWNLQARVFGMNARRRQAQRRAVSAVRLGLSIDVSAAIEQQLRDQNNVGRRLLTEVLDAIRRDVMKQRRLMLARR